MKLQHNKKMYPPRVKMSVTTWNPDKIFKLPVKITGSSDRQLDVDITIPLGKYTTCNYAFCNQQMRYVIEKG